MRLLRSSHLACVVAVTLLTSSLGWSQLSPESIAATDKTLQSAKAFVSKLDARQRLQLAGYGNLASLADAWHAYGMRLADPSFAARMEMARASNIAVSGASLVPDSLLASIPPGIVRVSNPNTDVAFSAFAGFTQSETSTARCGSSVVVGFNDSGSIFQTPLFNTGQGGRSLSGFAFSTNGGASFKDGGPMNPGLNTFNVLGGDPTITCSDPNTFYYSQLFNFLDSSGHPFTAVGVNKSTDGGKTWSDPTPAISKDNFFHALDKPWSAIDPSNPQTIYVSYTDFDVSHNSVTCGTDFREAIEFVMSTDGGNKWSTPFVAAEVCGITGKLSGSQVAVSSKGTMFIAWLNMGTNFPLSPRSIQVASFTPGRGAAVSAPVTVEPNIHPGGGAATLQGGFRDFLGMSMAIDHSGTANDGALYIAWADGRNKAVPDPFALQGFYAYDDILMRASFDGGQRWSFFATQINSDTQPRLGLGHDHFQPAVAVDNTGTIAICYYDRRADSENFAIRRHCGESTTSGSLWSDFDIGMNSWAPTHGNDVFVNLTYMGDYDQLTSDFLNQNSGFIGAFQNQGARGNPDVVAHSMQ
ncbi:MAG TPA: sialidase family protein [Candidatus Sulfotelmatobacter sp.]|nr:sialidase family protein [Candidatus Sulfotelmatobacter sp.]